MEVSIVIAVLIGVICFFSGLIFGLIMVLHDIKKVFKRLGK